MSYILVLLGGVVIGFAIRYIFDINKMAHGHFRVDLYDQEEDLYSVKVSIDERQNLLNKKVILLKRDSSQQ